MSPANDGRRAAFKVVSGGQSGVDRAALDAALALGLDYGGWCPRGGWAEDLAEPPGVLARYPDLRETPSADPAQRTLWNVRDSDATVAIVDSRGTAASAGTELALELAAHFGRPAIVLDVGDADSQRLLQDWLFVVSPAVLGIGGPRESEAPGIYNEALHFLKTALADA